MNKFLYLLSISSFLFFSTSCNHQKYPVKKIEIEPVSLFADTTPPKIFTWTFLAKGDTFLKFIMHIPAKETISPLINLQDTIVKYKYQVKEIFIDSLDNDLFTSQIICADSTKIIHFRSRAIDAVKIAKRFGAPITVDEKYLNKY